MPGKYQTLGNIQKTKIDSDWTGTTQGVLPEKKSKSYTDKTLDAFKKLQESGYSDDAIKYLYETFLVESSGGTDPSAGGNIMQIMPEGFEATKDIKSHPNLKNWYKKYKKDFDIDWNDVTYEQLKEDPFLGVLAARLHVANDPNPIGKTIEDRAEQWSLKYNTIEDLAGDSTYYLNKIQEIQEAYPNIKYQTTGNVQSDVQNMNLEVDAFAKEYAKSENFKSMLTKQGYDEKDIQNIIDDIIAFNPNENITYDANNPSAGSAYNPAFTFSSGEQTRAPKFIDKGVTNLNYNLEAGPPNHPFYNMWDQIVSHEGGHLGFMNNKLNRKTRKDLKNLIYPGSGDDAYSNLREQGISRKDAKKAVKHSEDPYEIRANLFQLRYQLNKAGIYNSFDKTSDGEFNIDHLKEIIEFDENGTFKKYKDEFRNEMFQNIHPQDIIWMMNNIAQAPQDNLPEEMARVQQGGPIKYQTKGNVQTWRDYTPTLTFPEMPSGEDANMASVFNWSTEVDDILNKSNLSEYHKQLESDYLRKKGGFTNYEHVARERGAPPLVLPYNTKWGSDPSHKQNYIFTKSEGREKQIAEWEENLKLLEGHPLYPIQYVHDDEEEFYESGGNVKRRCSGGRCEDDYPSVTNHYIFNNDESRSTGLTGAPEGTSATLLWEDGNPEVRTIYGKQSYPLAVYGDGVYQGILEPGQVLYTNPAMRIDEIPLGYSPNKDVANYFSSMQVTNQTDYTNQYNTELDKDQQILYDIFKKEFEIEDGTEKDLDLKGIFANDDYKELEGFDDEKYRKPNHPLFTNKSLYNNMKEGLIGGEFDGNTFNPSKTNMQHNNVDMLLTALSSSGGELALAPYFQESALNPVNYEKELESNYDELTNARNTRQFLEEGGTVYNDVSNKIKSLVRKNTRLRESIEKDNVYKNKMSKYQTTGAVSNPPNVPTYSDYTMFFGDDGTEYNFGNAYQKNNDWYFKKEGSRDYRVKDKELSNQITQFSNMVTLENNWDVIYDKNDKLKINLENPNSWTDQEALSFQKINSLLPIIDYNMGYYGTDDPNKIREKYNFNQNDLMWNYVSKPALNATTWLGEGVMPTNFNELLMITGGGLAFNKIFKYAANSPRLRKAFGIKGGTSTNNILKTSPAAGVISKVDNNILTTKGSPRLGKVKGAETKITIDGQPGVGNRIPGGRLWETNYQPYINNYIAKRANYYRSPEYLNAEIKALHPRLFDRRGKVIRGYEEILENYKKVYSHNINKHIESMDGNININFNANSKGNTAGDFMNKSSKRKNNYEINVYDANKASMSDMMNTLEHEINHLFSATGRYPNRTFGFVKRGPDLLNDVYSIGPLNANHPSKALYINPKTTSKDLGYVPTKDYKNYFMLEVHPKFRGAYGNKTIRTDKNGVPFLQAGDDVIPLVETKTGQQLLDDVANKIAQYEQNLSKRLGPKSGWSKQELAGFNKEVELMKAFPEGVYGNGQKINPKTTYITNHTDEFAKLSKDEFQYYMLPQEQQVRAMTARSIINKKFPNLKLGDYTEEHTKYLMDNIFKLNSNKTAYINKGNKWDLNALYRRLKAGNGEVLEVGSREWFKVITDHLNKAYGVAGVGTVGSQIE